MPLRRPVGVWRRERGRYGPEYPGAAELYFHHSRLRVEVQAHASVIQKLTAIDALVLPCSLQDKSLVVCRSAGQTHHMVVVLQSDFCLAALVQDCLSAGRVRRRRIPSARDGRDALLVRCNGFERIVDAPDVGCQQIDRPSQLADPLGTPGGALVLGPFC